MSRFAYGTISPAQLDRARGVMLGQFVGDALGTTVEFDAPDSIKRKYPSGHREIVGGGPFSVLAGQVTDDSELALALARCLVRDGWDLDARAQAYAAWVQSGPFDFGAATSAAFGGWTSAVTAEVMLARTKERNGGPAKQANGGLMRISPLAIYGAHLDAGVLASRAREDARLSHPSPVCQAANAAYVAALQVGIQGGTPNEGHEAAMAAADEPTVLEALSARVQPACHGKSQGWVLIALKNAFHMLLHEPSFEEALVRTVMAGGDTDTNGCIVGALLGAFHGMEKIPPRWIVKVLSCRTSRGPTYQTNDALLLADTLLERGMASAETGVSLSPEEDAFTSAARIAETAGGKLVAHERDPARRVVFKVPLDASSAREEIQRLLGSEPLRGQKYWVFDVERSSAAQQERSPVQVPVRAKPDVRTSTSHPIRVDWLGEQETRGKVGLTLAPGKRSNSKYSGGRWERDLDVDLEALVDRWGVGVLVCLLEDGDLKRLGIEDLVGRAEARALEVIRFPIRDVAVPKGSVRDLVQKIRDRAESGKNVVIHCEGGLGRAGTIAGCYLAQFGHDPEAILENLKESRSSRCPETDEQRQFIRDFCSNFG